MTPPRLLPFALLIVVGALHAQNPAPAGERGARDLQRPWSAEEAMAWHWLETAAGRLRRDPDAQLRLDSQGLPGFAMQLHAATDDGFAETGHPGPAPWVLYLVPASSSNAVDLVFCLASDGRLLLRDNRQRYSGSGELPAATAATGSGSRGTFADILGSPGNGRDGEFWRTRETLRPQRLAIILRDDRGEPVVGGRVALAPRSWLDGTLRVQSIGEFAPQTAALPAGVTALDSTGAGTLQGIAATGLVVCAGDDQGLVPLPADAITLAGDRMQLRLPLAIVQGARLNANESAAIATLKNISSAQAQCQASGVVDANRNGAGEYGYFGELSGNAPVRSDGEGNVGDLKISPPVLSTAFGNVQGGRVVRSGYVFQMFLPDATGAPVAEAATGGGRGAKIDPSRAEVLWCCYAWPVSAGTSGKRVFFVNQGGDVLSARNADGRYSGTGKAVEPKAAFDAQGSGLLQDAAAANADGHDGQTWTVIG